MSDGMRSDLDNERSMKAVLPTPPQLIVGLGHKARHGKDYVATELLCIDPRRIKIYSFASALKAWCRVNKLMTVKDGSILQTLGTDVFRKVDPDIWVRCLNYQLLEERPEIAVISDMRFPNESQFVKKMGGITVDILRYNPDGSLFLSPDRPANHPSEIALDGAEFDYTFRIKSGDLDGLRNAAFQIYTLICKCMVKEDANKSN